VHALWLLLLLAGQPEQRDSGLKRKFEDGLQQAEMRQFFRLHAQAESFEVTVAKARQFYTPEENELLSPDVPLPEQ